MITVKSGSTGTLITPLLVFWRLLLLFSCAGNVLGFVPGPRQISSPISTTILGSTTLVSEGAQMIDIECSIRHEILDETWATITTSAILLQNGFPSFTDNFALAYPGPDTNTKKKSHAYPGGNVCCKTSRRADGMGADEFARMAEQDGALCVCFTSEEFPRMPPQQPVGVNIPVIYIRDRSVVEYLSQFRVSKFKVLNYHEENRLCYTDLGPAETVKREQLDYFGFPYENETGGDENVATEGELWSMYGILQNPFPYRPYYHTILPHAEGSVFREEVEGMICITSTKGLIEAERFISMAEASGAAAVAFVQEEGDGDEAPTLSSIVERKLFRIPVFETNNNALLAGKHRITFRVPTQSDSLQNFDRNISDDSWNNGEEVLLNDDSARNQNGVLQVKQQTSTANNGYSSSSSIREWADANGVDEYYVEKLENQGAQFLEDVARLYVDSLTPPPAPTNIGSKAGVLSFDSIQLEGVGGLGKELDALFTQAFSTRMVPNQVIKELGLKHTRGVILYGPPGTGKTLIARELGKTLDAKEVTVVAGPEILSKFLGDSEERVRVLFANAEEDQKKLGDDSGLHVIILDEIDAICSKRSEEDSNGGGTKTLDSIVNQFLAKMDGVEQLNNILLIGLTNRIESLDDALLRPGRFEVQIRIDLPDVDGRLEILRIHTSTMHDSGRLSNDVDLEEIAGATDGMSGADLSGLVRAAGSLAIKRFLTNRNNSNDESMQMSGVDSLVVQRCDFQAVLESAGREIKSPNLQGWYR